MGNQTKLNKIEEDTFINLSKIQIIEGIKKYNTAEGFPLGEVDDLIMLSDPPLYTAYPNPYIDLFCKEYGSEYDENKEYNREPFVGDVSEGKGNVIYNGHTYHTKVPHKAIIQFIEHYTEKGDIVFDGFCGTGMTGVAANFVTRHSILSDLSPIATFIAKNNTSENVDLNAVKSKIKEILNEVEKEFGWTYKTQDKGLNGKINYVIWSDVFLCPHCKLKYLFCDLAIQKETVSTEYVCPGCSSKITKSSSERVYTSEGFAKQEPFLMNVTINGKRYFKKLDEQDFLLLKNIEGDKSPVRSLIQFSSILNTSSGELALRMSVL